MARKYKYTITNHRNHQTVGEIEATSFNDANRIASRQFGDDVIAHVELTDADVSYLRRVSTNALKYGHANLRDVAYPWFRLNNGRSIDDTHYKNIVDSMPNDLQIKYYIATDDTSELENYDLDDFIGVHPKYEISKLSANERTPEAYATIYGNFLAKAQKADLSYYQPNFWANHYDDILYFVAENVPADKFSEKLNKYIRMYIVQILKGGDFFSNDVFGQLPESVFSGRTTYMKNIIAIYPDYIFDFPGNSANIDTWIYAFQAAIAQRGFTGPASDDGVESMMEYSVPENIKSDPRIQALAVKYKEVVDHEQAEADKRWQDGQKERDEQQKKQHDEYMASLSTDSNALGRINKYDHTPEMYQVAISHHPRAIFHVPAGSRTKEMWIQAVTADPSLIEYVRPFDLQAEIKQELSAGDELNQIKNLAQPK